MASSPRHDLKSALHNVLVNHGVTFEGSRTPVKDGRKVVYILQLGNVSLDAPDSWLMTDNRSDGAESGVLDESEEEEEQLQGGLNGVGGVGGEKTGSSSGRMPSTGSENLCAIPHGYKVAFVALHAVWTTQVKLIHGSPMYSAAIIGPDGKEMYSGRATSASSALRMVLQTKSEAMRLRANGRHHDVSAREKARPNGRLCIGLFYFEVQYLIRKSIRAEIEKTGKTPTVRVKNWLQHWMTEDASHQAKALRSPMTSHANTLSGGPHSPPEATLRPRLRSTGNVLPTPSMHPAQHPVAMSHPYPSGDANLHLHHAMHPQALQQAPPPQRPMPGYPPTHAPVWRVGDDGMGSAAHYAMVPQHMQQHAQPHMSHGMGGPKVVSDAEGRHWPEPMARKSPRLEENLMSPPALPNPLLTNFQGGQYPGSNGFAPSLFPQLSMMHPSQMMMMRPGEPPHPRCARLIRFMPFDVAYPPTGSAQVSTKYNVRHPQLGEYSMPYLEMPLQNANDLMQKSLGGMQ